MLGDTITFTINAVAKVLNKINQDGYAAEYALFEGTGEIRARVTHKRDKANAAGQVYVRHVLDLVKTTYATPTTLAVEERSYVTIRCLDGDSVEMNKVLQGQLAYLSASSGANAVKIMNWES